MQKAEQESEEGLKIMSGLNPPLQGSKRGMGKEGSKAGMKGMHLGSVLESSWKTISPLFLYELPARKLLHHDSCPAAHVFPGGMASRTWEDSSGDA